MHAARALPPREPNSAATDFHESRGSSVSSPVAIRMTLTVAPITSAGRFSPRGPLGIVQPLFGNHTIDRSLKAPNLSVDRRYAFLGEILPYAARRSATHTHCAIFIGPKFCAQTLL